MDETGTRLSRLVVCGRCGESCRDADSVTIYLDDRVDEICHEACLDAWEREHLEHND